MLPYTSPPSAVPFLSHCWMPGCKTIQNLQGWTVSPNKLLLRGAGGSESQWGASMALSGVCLWKQTAPPSFWVSLDALWDPLRLFPMCSGRWGFLVSSSVQVPEAITAFAESAECRHLSASAEGGVCSSSKQEFQMEANYWFCCSI